MNTEERNWLVVDVGNSSTSAAVWNPADGSLRRFDDRPTPDESRGATGLAGDLARLGAAEGAAKLALVSVVPRLDAELATPWKNAVLIGSGTPLPFGVDIENLETVGADRLCNMAAARREGLDEALVIDLGTATTFDLLQGGVFRGGLIAPGMAFAAEKLGRGAARLDPVEFAASPLEVGRDTPEALARGCYHAGVQGVSGVIAGLLERYGERSVILTGGLARHIVRAGWRTEPDWTLLGAAHLAGLVHPAGPAD